MKTETKTTFEIGSSALFLGSDRKVPCVIIGCNKGWYQIQLDNGIVRKVRAKQLEVIELEDDELEDDENLGKMSKILAKARSRYVATKTPKGRTSATCGDSVSKLMQGMDLDQALNFAEECLGLGQGALHEKYDGLNPGHARMNAGNRVRGAINRGDITIEEATEMSARYK